MKKRKSLILSLIAVILIFVTVACGRSEGQNTTTTKAKETSTASYAGSVSVSGDTTEKTESFDLDSIPPFSGEGYVVINDNKPDFKDSDLVTNSYESYGALDKLGRCTSCIACVGKDLMPTGQRDSISAVKPTGWQTQKYSFVDGGSLYNRCHLIAYQLTGESANKKNLITGTRFMNVQMIPFENKAADYVKATGKHVLYRVTPIFKDNELVARGVQMEAMSVEDKGKSVCFNVYCYNNQPRIEIDYMTGKSKEVAAQSTSDKKEQEQGSYVLNTKGKKFHKPDCDSVKQMSDKNKKYFNGSRDELINNGYKPCGACQP